VLLVVDDQRLKIPWPQGRAGWNPAPGTIKTSA
jgi:hypothetical protein